MLGNQDNYNFNSMDIIRFIFKHKWPIIIITLIAAIVSIIVSLSITPKFKSSVVLYPKTQVSVSHALTTSELIDPDDHIMNFGDEEATEQLIQTLYSEYIRFAIIKKFDLMNHYNIDKDSEFPLTKLSEEIRDNIKYKYGYLEECYTRIMNRIKAFFRDPVPLAMHAINPVMA